MANAIGNPMIANADTLDGLHADSFARSTGPGPGNLVVLPYISAYSLTGSQDATVCSEALLKEIWRLYGSAMASKVFIGPVSFGSIYAAIGIWGPQGLADNGLPLYAGATLRGYNQVIQIACWEGKMTVTKATT